MKRLTTCLIIMSILAIAQSCSSAGVTRTDLPVISLPDLATVDTVQGPSARLAAASAEQILVPGADYLLKSDEATVIPAGLDLVIGLDLTSWGIYRVDGLSDDYYPVELQIDVDQSSIEYYFAIGNYSLGHWQFHPAPLTGDQQIAISLDDWGEYQSASGSLVFAIVAWQQAVTHVQTIVTVEDQRPLPAPTNLAATALNQSVQLGWDLYPDERADRIRASMSTSSDMSGSTIIQATDAANTTMTIGGLENGTTYYFAVTAYRLSDQLESVFGNIVSAVPEAGSGPVELSGLWPRKGNLGDNRGCTTNLGPVNLSNVSSADIAGARHTELNRTSPVIDLSGRVYALTGDGYLVCLSADLQTTHWEFSAGTFGSPGAQYVCPPHSPIIDSEGRSYFIAATQSPGGVSYLFCVDSSGGLVWRSDLGEVSTDVTYPYATPTITSDGWIAVVSGARHKVSRINAGDGVIHEQFDITDSAEIFADPALSSRGTLEFPVWRSGIGIPEDALRWQSIDETTMDAAANHRGNGVRENIFGGLIVGSQFHAYPEANSVNLLNASTGASQSVVEFNEATSGMPSRNNAGTYIFQPHIPFGFANTAYIMGVQVGTSDPPALTQVFSLQLGNFSVTGQPAVDGSGALFFADEFGNVFRAYFDPSQPVDINNPVITDQQKFDPDDSYFYASFAIGNSSAYIVSENNTLYRIYDPE